jgi:hypothetical protein
MPIVLEGVTAEHLSKLQMAEVEILQSPDYGMSRDANIISSREDTNAAESSAATTVAQTEQLPLTTCNKGSVGCLQAEIITETVTQVSW